MDLSLDLLDLAQLARAYAATFDDRVLRRLRQAGFEVRLSDGYVIQHLVDGPCPVGALAERLEVSQQAASKRIRDLEARGLVERAPSGDARVRAVQLSARGRACLGLSRRVRRAMDASIRRTVGAADAAAARRALARAIERLGGAERVRGRRLLDEGSRG